MHQSMKINRISSRIKEQGRPLLPRKGQEGDPTMQGRNRDHAEKEIRKRFSKVNSRVVEAVASFLRDAPKVKLANNASYTYESDYSSLGDISKLMASILGDELGADPITDIADPSKDFWLSQYIEKSYESGLNLALQGAKDVAVPSAVGQSTSSYIRGIDSDIIKTDPSYEKRVGMVSGRSFGEIKGLSTSMAAELSSVLTRAMKDGLGIGETTSLISERVGVSESSAQRIARTEINGAYRTATRQETDNLNSSVFSESEYEMRQLWFSALSPTTRPTHASRHAKTFTAREILEFYAKDANEINCLCSSSPILVNKKTGAIFQEDSVEQMRKEREDYQRSIEK